MGRRKRKQPPPQKSTGQIVDEEFSEELPIDDDAAFTEDMLASDLASDEPETAPASVPTSPLRAVTPPSGAEAFARGAAQGATLLWGDEASAGLEGLLERISPIPGVTGQPRDVNVRDIIRNENRQAADANPKSYLTGQVLGGAMTQAPVAMATGGASIPSLMAQGAAAGAIGGAGASEGDRPLDVASDALEGAEVGAVIPPLAAAAKPIMSYLGRPIANAGARMLQSGINRRLPAAGLDQRAIREVQNMRGGIPRFAEDIDRLGINAGRMPNVESQMGNAERVVQSAGARMGAALNKVSVPAQLSPRVAEQLLRSVGRHSGSVQDDVASAIDELQTALTQSTETGTLPEISPASAHRLRRLVGEAVEPGSDQQTKREASALYAKLSESIEAAMDQVDPAVRNEWRNASRDYQVANQIASGAERHEARQLANRPVGLTDTIVGATAMTNPSAGLPMAAARALGNRAYRGREHAMWGAAQRGIGRGAQSLANQMEGAGAGIAASGRLVTGSAGQNLSERSQQRLGDVVRINPQALGPYARPLQNALEQGGDEGLAVAHFKLHASSPGYRQTMERVGVQEGDE